MTQEAVDITLNRDVATELEASLAGAEDTGVLSEAQTELLDLLREALDDRRRP